MLRALKPILFILAVIYFGIDELFTVVARPIAAWLARQHIFHQFRNWSLSLRPYAALVLFAIPLLILEPVKPIAAYLAATGHLAAGGALFVIGEILKLVLVERLLQLNRRKLTSIPAFAWCYVHLCAVWSWLESFAILAERPPNNSDTAETAPAFLPNLNDRDECPGFCGDRF